jgi:hypothetical protein
MGKGNSDGAAEGAHGVYSGGSGASIDDAVVITPPTPQLGIPAEYAYVEMQCGRRGVDWAMLVQALLLGPGGRRYDRLRIKLKNGTERDFYFDITSFYNGY